MLSTDLGQVTNPPVEDGLALMADRLLEAGFSEDDVRTMAVVEHPEAGRCLRRLLVVSAHSADFVWRAAGAIATVVEARRDGARRLALLRRARRVGRALEAAGPDRGARQGDPPRRGADGRRRAGRRLPQPRPRRLPARHGRRRRRAAHRPGPRARAAADPHARRARPVQPRPRGRARRDGAGAAARERRGRRERVQDDRAARAADLRAASARAVRLRADDVPRHHIRVEQEGGGDGGDGRPGVPQAVLLRARGAPGQSRPAHLRPQRHPLRRGLPARDPRRGRARCDRLRRLRPPGRGDRARGRRPHRRHRPAADAGRARLARRGPCAHRPLRAARQHDGARADRGRQSRRHPRAHECQPDAARVHRRAAGDAGTEARGRRDPRRRRRARPRRARGHRPADLGALGAGTGRDEGRARRARRARRGRRRRDPAGRSRRDGLRRRDGAPGARASTRCCRWRSSASEREEEMRKRYAAGELSYDVQGIRKLVEGG